MQQRRLFTCSLIYSKQLSNSHSSSIVQGIRVVNGADLSSWGLHPGGYGKAPPVSCCLLKGVRLLFLFLLHSQVISKFPILNMHDFFFFLQIHWYKLAHHQPHLFKVCSWTNVGRATPVRPAAQRRVQACLACSLCSFGMNSFLSPSTTSPSPFNHPSALCHQGLVCISRIFYQLKSMAWALFHLASLTECHDFEIHPSCCV